MPRKKTARAPAAAPAQTESKARASWRGMLRFGLVAFPVEAYNARASDAGSIALNQLHAECHSRIRYQKTCPIHGVVSNDEIVSGYEVSKGRYVEVDPSELNKLRTEKERALTIDTFVTPEDLDSIYLDGRMYYLSPDGDAAREPYAVFLEALQRQGRIGVGQVVFSGREQIVLIRPYSGVLQMGLLNYFAEIRNPDQVFGALPAMKGADKKVRLAEQLIESWSEEHFDFAKYEDHYVQQLKSLIESKVEGRELVTPEAEPEEPEVINLMDALRKSIGKPSREKTPERETRPAPRKKRAAHSRRAS